MRIQKMKTSSQNVKLNMTLLGFSVFLANKSIKRFYPVVYRNKNIEKMNVTGCFFKNILLFMNCNSFSNQTAFLLDLQYAFQCLVLEGRQQENNLDAKIFYRSSKFPCFSPLTSQKSMRFSNSCKNRTHLSYHLSSVQQVSFMIIKFGL